MIPISWTHPLWRRFWRTPGALEPPIHDGPAEGGDLQGEAAERAQEAEVAPSPAPKPDYSLMADSLAVARTQIGVREQPPGSNSGPEVDGYLRSVGRQPGDPWCAALVFSCIQQAWVKRHGGWDEYEGAPAVPFPRTAYTPRIWSWAQRQGPGYWASPAGVHLGREVTDGALFLLYGKVGETERVNHVGFVERLDLADQVVCTIEGNTNPAGSREGGGVFRRERRLGGIYRFVLSWT